MCVYMCVENRSNNCISDSKCLVVFFRAQTSDTAIRYWIDTYVLYGSSLSYEKEREMNAVEGPFSKL